MLKPIEVKALFPHRIWIKYSNGEQGNVDLSHLAGKGVFKSWDDPQEFDSVHISQDGAIEWKSGIDLCPDALYMRLTGKAPEEIFSNLKTGAHA